MTANPKSLTFRPRIGFTRPQNRLWFSLRSLRGLCVLRVKLRAFSPSLACYLCARESMRRALILTGILVVSSSLILAQALFQKPVKVIGDSDFIGTAANPLAYHTIGPNWVEGRELQKPSGIALDNSVSPPILYIADSGNNRVLGYRYTTQTTPGALADIVIGQIDFYSNVAQNPANGGRQTGLNNPTGLAVDSAGNLYVADTGNNRILRFPQPFSSANANQFPSLVIGQKTYATTTQNLSGLSASSLAINANNAGRTGIAFDSSGNLWVADGGNNRVLRFPASALSAGANFPAADTVIGQPGFTATSTVSPNRGSTAAFSGPNGISLDSAGNLYVTDQLYRVLVFNAPLTTAMAASAILGVDTTSTSATTPTQTEMNAPTGVLGLTSGPVVADTGNNRVLVYAPQSQWTQTTLSPAATTVIGQTSFTVNTANEGNADAGAGTLQTPVDFALNVSELYVVDSGNNRVLVFTYAPTGVSANATRVIGQLDFPYYGPNLVDGKGFSFPGPYPGGAVLDNSVAPARLYVADTVNNRILGFRNFTNLQNGIPADLVIGQPDFNRIVPNYPTGSTTVPTQSGLYLPTGLTIDSAGNLYVSDTGNSRVVRFPAPYASGTTSLESADLVLGQTNFTTNITDATSVTLNSPVGLGLTSGAAKAGGTAPGWLAVADSAQNRVLMFPTPFVSGMNASVVLGQSNFTNSTAGAGLTGLNSPRGLAIDPQDRIIVADTTNTRVQIFDSAPYLANGAQAVNTITSGFTTPVSVSTGPGGDFWVADYGANRSLHFPAVPNLPLTNNAPDASLGGVGPHWVYVDTANNLLLTDSLNRVLYFAPQINLANAATYSTRALAAGTVAALFPTVTTNSIAKGTAPAPANQFPLPTVLGDTSVTVGGTPVPLLYVSPGQDNIILPQALPTSGSVDLQAIQASTGQILGGAEIELAAASPGLFAYSGGAGPLVAVNLQDSTLNSTAHPVVRGQYVILYGTGVGPVANPPADGTAASGQPASDFPQVLIASSGSTTSSTGTTTPLPAFIPATVNYSGLAPGFAGLWQINVQIPLEAQSGSAVVIKLYEKDIPNLDQTSALTTTLAVN